LTNKHGEKRLSGEAYTALENALRRKKAAPAPIPTPVTTPAAAPGGTQSAQSAVLMEATNQETDFSTEAVPPSAFQVPKGFKIVASRMPDGKIAASAAI
jgi:hypothetical protein